MFCVFMDNFRGFRDTLLPLAQINFLVGENSTGKSSYLKLLHALSRPNLWFSPEPFPEESELGGFEDMVSAWSSERAEFQVGLVRTSTVEETGRLACSFFVFRFRNQDGSPRLSRYLQFADGRLTKLAFNKRIKYKTTQAPKEFDDENDVTKHFFDTVHADVSDSTGFGFLPRVFSPDLPVAVIVAMVKSLGRADVADLETFAEVPLTFDLTWIAPIRTRPQRFYEGLRKAFSPEGDHTPVILRQSLERKARTGGFASRLKAFGEASGLFEAVIAHSFDKKSPQSPFEILVRFPQGDLNLCNVGYGVSQVLPLLVEFLSPRKDRRFAVQQPEVHLHPRAQAAFGDLIAEAAIERGHGFILETHSDYLIDRCRLNLSKQKRAVEAQTIFFERTATGNQATVLPIGKNGRYPDDQPPAFRAFFVREEMKLLEM